MGSVLLHVAMPSPLSRREVTTECREDTAMGVVIGMDPHKRSEVIDQAGRVLEVGRFGPDKAGYAAMLAAGRQHGSAGERVW